MENVVTTCRLVTKFSPAAAGVFEAQTQLITVCSKQIVPTSHTVVSCFFFKFSMPYHQHEGTVSQCQLM